MEATGSRRSSFAESTSVASADSAASERPIPRRKGSITSLDAGGSGGRMSRASVRTINSLYSKGSLNSEDVDALQEAGSFRLVLAGMLYGSHLEIGIGSIALANFFLINMMADCSARDERPPLWVVILNWACVACYAGELIIRLYVERYRIFARGWNWVDIMVVLVSITCEVLAMVHERMDKGMFDIFRVFQMLRLVRFIRAAKVLGRIKELRKLVKMMVSCCRTLFWSFCLTFMVMTVWAHMAVVLIQPLVEELGKQGMWGDCEECLRSFASVMRANLTLFQTIVASDSWGKVAVPVIEMYPWAAVVFIGAWLTLIFGAVNLIVAAMVDAFAEAREADVRSRAQELTEEESREKDTLERVFKKIDYDGSGNVTFERLKDAAESVPEFRQRLRVMDVGVKDLQELFRMIDEDGSGMIEAREFIDVLYRLKQTDSNSVTVFLKHYVVDLGKKQKRMDRKIHDIDETLGRILYCLGGRTSCHDKLPTDLRASFSRTSTLSSSVLGSLSAAAPRTSCVRASTLSSSVLSVSGDAPRGSCVRASTLSSSVLTASGESSRVSCTRASTLSSTAFTSPSEGGCVLEETECDWATPPVSEEPEPPKDPVTVAAREASAVRKAGSSITSNSQRIMSHVAARKRAISSEDAHSGEEASETDDSNEVGSSFSSPDSEREGSYQLVTHKTQPRMGAAVIV